MGTPTKASDRQGGFSIPPIAVASMDDDPPDPFSPDTPGPSRLPGDVVTPRTTSARRALREHELALRAHESGTAEYRRMLSDAEQGMEKLLTMNATLRRELELERRASTGVGRADGTRDAVLAATLEDTRSRLRETEVQLERVTDAFEALKRERAEATAVLQSNAAVRKALDAERVQLEGAREDLTSRAADVATRAHKVRSEAAQHRAALELKIVSRVTKEDDAAIAAYVASSLSGLEEKLLELERFASRPAPHPPDNGGANRPGIAHAVAAERAIATEGEVRRVREVNVELRDRIRTLEVDLQMSRAREASAAEGARLARDFARAEDEVREVRDRPEVEALRAELEKANEAVRRSEAHALVAAERSHEADRLQILLAERETEIGRLRRQVSERERATTTRNEETLARPVAALPLPSPRKSRQSARGGSWAVNDETVIEDTMGSRDFHDSGDNSGDDSGDDPEYVPEHDLDPVAALEELKAHRRARRAVRKLRRWEAARDIVPVAPDREPDGDSSVYQEPVRRRVQGQGVQGQGVQGQGVQGQGPGSRRQVPFRPAGVAGLELSRGLSTAIGQARLALADAERELTEAHERRMSARRQRESVARLYRGGHARTSVARKEPAPPWAKRRP